MYKLTALYIRTNITICPFVSFNTGTSVAIDHIRAGSSISTGSGGALISFFKGNGLA